MTRPRDDTSMTLSAAGLAGVGRDDGGLGHVRRFVAGVRNRARRRDMASGWAAALAGAAGVFLAASAGTALASSAALVTVLIAGVAFAAAGVVRIARAYRRGPGGHEVADWIERACPELRDSLATAIEGGSLAPVSARYAAARLPPARDLVFEPRRRIRARRVVFAVSVGFLVAVVLTRALSGAPRNAANGENARAADERAAVDSSVAPERPGTTPGVPVGDAVPAAPAPSVRPRAEPGVPAAPVPPAVEVVAPRRPAGDGREEGLAPARAAEILVSAPEGFERAVEEFVGGTKPEPERGGDGGEPTAP